MKKSIRWSWWFLTPVVLASSAIVASCSTTTEATNNQQTVLKTQNFDQQNLNLPKAIDQAQKLINSQWIVEQKNKLFSGTTTLLTNPNQVQKLDVQISQTNQKTLSINLVLAAGAIVGNNSQPTTVPSNFAFIISGFLNQGTVPPTEAKPPAPDGTTFVDPNKYPELFQDSHLFDLATMEKVQNTNQILQNTSLFKYSLSNFKFFLKNYQNPNSSQKGVNFILNQFDETMTKVFFKMLENVGIYGDYKFDNDVQLMEFTPQTFIDKYLLVQKYLPTNENNFNNFAAVKSASVNAKIDQLIKNNPFGFLPSNLSQLFYYLDWNSISQIFEIANVKDLSANFDDQQGTINFQVTDVNGQGKSFAFSTKDLNHLKQATGFKKFIFERTFWMQGRFWKYEPQGINGSNGYRFVEKTLGGTAWILDRLQNPALEQQDQYEFLVGTNMHVVNLSPFFEKNHFIANAGYNQYWNGGFVNRANNGAGAILDQKQSHQVNNRTYEELIKASNNVAQFRFGYYQNRDYEAIENGYDSGIDQRSWTNAINLTSENYLDMVWYTPRFASENVRSEKAGESEYLFGENNYDQFSRSGTIHNAGTDFVIMKIVLSKAQVQMMFPELAPLIGTAQEKDWYIGLGTDQLVNPSNTFFAGGFPLGGWKTLQTNGGRIKTKDREVSRQTTQSYWKKYDSAENEFINQFNARKDWYTQPQRDDMQHGMRIEHIMQDSILHIKSTDGQYLNGGASGSMVIDSRFNIVGIIFNKVLPPDGDANDPEAPAITNSVSLFRHQSQFKNWSGSILQDVQAKLQAENLTSIKLNSPKGH